MENLNNFFFNTSELRVIFTTSSQLSKHFKLKIKLRSLKNILYTTFVVQNMTQTILERQQESFNIGWMNFRQVTLTIKTFRAKRLFTSNVIEFKGTKILGRLFFIRTWNISVKKMLEYQLQLLMSLKILYLNRNLTFTVNLN